MISNTDSNDILQEAKNLYKVNHLPFPSVPDIYTKDILKISEWVYGTRINARSPYATDSYIEELLTGDKTSYVVFGHAGHGIMSYGLHF